MDSVKVNKFQIKFELKSLKCNLNPDYIRV